MLKKLEDIELAGNGFEGMLPPCLNNLTSLSYLDISGNRFNGNLSSSPIASLTSLEYIDLSYNLFEGLFSFSLFANHSKLKGIQFLSDNNKLDIEIDNWDPLFQLKVLVLSNFYPWAVTCDYSVITWLDTIVCVTLSFGFVSVN